MGRESWVGLLGDRGGWWEGWVVGFRPTPPLHTYALPTPLRSHTTPLRPDTPTPCNRHSYPPHHTPAPPHPFSPLHSYTPTPGPGWLSIETK